jgi:hypothetical protein
MAMAWVIIERSSPALELSVQAVQDLRIIISHSIEFIERPEVLRG